MLLYIASGWLYTDILSYRIYIDRYGSIILHILNTWEISPQKKNPPPHSHHVFADSHDIRFIWDLGEWHHLERCNYCMSLVTWKVWRKNSNFNSQMTDLHPERLRWKVEITHLERKMIFQTSMIMFHVNLQGCMEKTSDFQQPNDWFYPIPETGPKWLVKKDWSLVHG